MSIDNVWDKLPIPKCFHDLPLQERELWYDAVQDAFKEGQKSVWEEIERIKQNTTMG